MNTWTVDNIFSLILIIWVVVVLLQSLLALFKVKLSNGQVGGIILIAAGILWLLAVLPSSPLQSLITYYALPDPWYVLGGLLIVYGIRYLLPFPAKDIVALLACVALLVGGFYLFTSLTPPPYWQGQQGEINPGNASPLPHQKGNRPFPAPLRIYNLRNISAEELTWAEDSSSALSFRLNFGSLYVSQITSTEDIGNKVGFGTYSFDVSKTATAAYELIPQGGSDEAGALFLSTNVNDLSLADSYGAIYMEIVKPMQELEVNSKMGDITIDSAAGIGNIKLNSYAGNVDINLNEPTSTLTIQSRAGNINIYTSTVIDNVQVKADAGNLRMNVPTGVKVIVENMGSVNRLSNNSDPQGYNGTMKLYLDMKMGNVTITTLEP
ncbi:DUF4097 family beta strand repeat-containing protein [Coprothermobacter platensis]|uniref:DUF4097 family beta strand repeat-containing protein n=1 Tax=Coprothermobacter platensis TaxID=108819 RepID=UPI00036C3F18|nr:DUF4097 family beta strand repeat-containing protein [Coprothermobacter platensis]